MQIEYPRVLKKGCIEQEFDPFKIHESLGNETSLTFEERVTTTQEVVRFIVSNRIKLLTAPLIREIVNVQLLHLGFEKSRLLYTRIGFPYYDLDCILRDTTLTREQKREVVFSHVLIEYEAVKELIRK